jgi:hypothetical protein
MAMRITAMMLICCAALGASAGCESADRGGGDDSSGDSDGDSDSDGDTDSDGDSDSDGDTDTWGDGGPDEVTCDDTGTYCEETCVGWCRVGVVGDCGGMCCGTCDSIPVEGDCSGLCDGQCYTQVSGYCEGQCIGSCN